MKLWGPNSNGQFENTGLLNLEPKWSIDQVMQIKRNGSEQIILPFLFFAHYKINKTTEKHHNVSGIHICGWKKWKKIHSSYQCQSWKRLVVLLHLGRYWQIQEPLWTLLCKLATTHIAPTMYQWNTEKSQSICFHSYFPGLLQWTQITKVFLKTFSVFFFIPFFFSPACFSYIIC